MLQRLIEIIFPVFAVVCVGYLLGRYRGTDLGEANRLNLAVFVPAIVFVSLAGSAIDLGALAHLAAAGALLIGTLGVIAWAASRIAGFDAKTLVPPMMFNNSGNIGLPVAFLTWGAPIMPAAVMLFVVQTTLQFSVGVRILDPQMHPSSLLRIPVVLATLAGLAVAGSGVALWPPLLVALRLLGDIAIPLMLLGLGVRLAQTRQGDWTLSIVLALLRPLVGFALAWAIAMALGLEGRQAELLMVFGALPPAVMNFLFAERYGQEPERVASIVLIGNVAAVLVLPLAIGAVLH
jgi:predicted permease